MSEFKVGDIVYIKGFNECGAIKVVHENFMDKIVRYEVKTNNNEYTLLGTMLEHIDNHSQNTQQLEQRIEKLEKEVFKPVEIHDKPKETKPSLLTEDERVILRNLDKKWKWIARDMEDNNLHIYTLEPTKVIDCWNVAGLDNYENFYIYNHLFQFIKWNDKEPCNIEKLLKGECGNE